jgi:glutamate synthase domain-containing protein 3
VGYGDDVVRCYQLEDLRAHVWIGHHRYPTKGRVWHPGGAHPFVGLHEGLVHNGDFANYASICEYLAQRNIHPLFLTDTEVSVLVFDLLYRVYGYPLEYVIEALAPTTERDFTLLPAEKQEIYRLIQTTHIHGSPDGPWFFLLAQSVPPARASRLIGITDTSMLRPQVFALQQGEAGIGFAASEKQAIDAALESLAAEDSRFWSQADLYWNARGGSHTDGGAFLFHVEPDTSGTMRLECTNKFGAPIRVDASRPALGVRSKTAKPSAVTLALDAPPAEQFAQVTAKLPAWSGDEACAALEAIVRNVSVPVANDAALHRAIGTLTLLLDRRYPTGALRPSSLRSLVQGALGQVFEAIRANPSENFLCLGAESPALEARTAARAAARTLVLDARGFPPEGPSSLARRIVELYEAGARKFLVVHTRGHRFIANGLGPESQGARFDVYGSPGDYLASGIDGAEVVVHASGQDQLAQIMKDGKLVVHGDVGQTFMYGAKGGQAFILGNAAGRPMINAVGRPRVVINGTCLDYLAESFMAGDPLDGGGFVLLNGIRLDDDGRIGELDTPYPGGNLFSLSSGGAIYVRDPHGRLTEDQLNGGEFATLEDADWQLIRPYLEENERLFGISLAALLEVEGTTRPPVRVYRKIRPQRVEALQAEEAWVRGNT